jgi:hypothetical protein
LSHFAIVRGGARFGEGSAGDLEDTARTCARRSREGTHGNELTVRRQRASRGRRRRALGTWVVAPVDFGRSTVDDAREPRVPTSGAPAPSFPAPTSNNPKNGGIGWSRSTIARPAPTGRSRKVGDTVCTQGCERQTFGSLGSSRTFPPALLLA